MVNNVIYNKPPRCPTNSISYLGTQAEMQRVGRLFESKGWTVLVRPNGNQYQMDACIYVRIDGNGDPIEFSFNPCAKMGSYTETI